MPPVPWAPSTSGVLGFASGEPVLAFMSFPEADFLTEPSAPTAPFPHLLSLPPLGPQPLVTFVWPSDLLFLTWLLRASPAAPSQPRSSQPPPRAETSTAAPHGPLGGADPREPLA